MEDPLERANLKDRYPDIYHKLAREWLQWSSTMLPEVAESFTHAFSGKELADHYGAKPKPDEDQILVIVNVPLVQPVVPVAKLKLPFAMVLR